MSVHSPKDSQAQSDELSKQNESAAKEGQKATMQANIASRSSSRNNKAKGAFLTIREVAEDLDLQQHVLRFWETKFSQVKPLKRGGGRRYYRPDDVVLLKNIKYLLYTEGYTIKGVQKLLKTEGKKALSSELIESAVQDYADEPVRQPSQGTEIDSSVSEDLSTLLGDLKSLRSYIQTL